MTDQTQTPAIEVNSIVRPIGGEGDGDLFRVLEIKRGGWLSVESLDTHVIGNVRANTVELGFIEQDDEQDSNDDETGQSRMAQTLARYRARYPKATKPNGKSTQDKGDQIADLLRPLEPLEVAAIADRVFEEPQGTHAAKYAHLNNGQIRMNSGNRIRAKFLKSEADEMARILAIIDQMTQAVNESEQDSAVHECPLCHSMELEFDETGDEGNWTCCGCGHNSVLQAELEAA